MKEISDIGSQIAKQRRKLGWTQLELAKKSNLSLRTIQRIENNETNPRAYTIRILKESLNVNLKEMNTKTVSDKEIKNWLIALHLTNLLPLVIPAIIIWTLKRDEIPDLDQHGKDVINFQISYFLFLLVLLLSIVGFVIMPFVGIYCWIITILNVINIVSGKPYKYHLKFNFIK